MSTVTLPEESGQFVYFDMDKMQKHFPGWPYEKTESPIESGIYEVFFNGYFYINVTRWIKLCITANGLGIHYLEIAKPIIEREVSFINLP